MLNKCLTCFFVVLVIILDTLKLVGSPISKVRVSSHLNFFNPLTVAIISASVEDRYPIGCLELLEPRKDSPIYNIQPVWMLHHHDEKPKRHRDVSGSLIAGN